MNMKWIGRAEFALGVWLLLAPWALGFSKIAAALWNSAIAGTLLIIIAMWHLFGRERDHSHHAPCEKNE